MDCFVLKGQCQEMDIFLMSFKWSFSANTQYYTTKSSQIFVVVVTE
jgi:hypothetical protein